MTVEDVLKLAQSQLGYKENPSGSNKTKYGEWYGLNGQPWCMMFIQWLFKDNKDLLPIKTASCTAFMNSAKKSGQWVTSGYQAGDIILYNFDSKSDADHIGLCISAIGSNVTCIEGNTSLSSDDNGGSVMKRTRKTTVILGAFRPAYKADFKPYRVRIIAKSGLNIRKSYSSKSDKLGAYKFGTTVTVIAVKDDWLKTDKGWIAGKYTSKI